jgi:hypothetical protein
VAAFADDRHSFGAVLEEFEVSDAVMTVLAGKYSNGNPTPAV